MLLIATSKSHVEAMLKDLRLQAGAVGLELLMGKTKLCLMELALKLEALRQTLVNVIADRFHDALVQRQGEAQADLVARWEQSIA